MTLLLVLPYMASAAYTPQLQGRDVSGFNTLVYQWNAWVAANFGQNSNLLMQKMASNAANLQQPSLYGNNTTTPKGIVHVIDPTFRINGLNAH